MRHHELHRYSFCRCRHSFELHALDGDYCCEVGCFCKRFALDRDRGDET